MQNKWKFITTTSTLIVIIIAFLWVLRTFTDILGYPKVSPEELSGIIAELEVANIEGEKRFQGQMIKEAAQWKKEWEAIKVADNSNYPQANEKVIVWKGIIENMMSYQQPGKKYNWVTKTKNGETWQEAEETGYVYTYTYKDLGIKISTSPFLLPFFYEKTDKPLVIRNGNILYVPKEDGTISSEYLEVYFKDPKKSFEAEIRDNQLSSGCTIQTGVVKGEFSMSKHMAGFPRIAISSMDGNLAPDSTCIMDKKLPSNTSFIYFYMNPKQKDRYYKLSFNDACAPGPCTIIGDIEFF